MLKAKDNQEINDPDKIRRLVQGSLSEDESLEYLRLLSGGAGLGQIDSSIFKHVIDTVRASVISEKAQLFADAGKMIDCCGTGGSGLSHYNTSTTVAFILAAAGLKVAKFGNRAASSKSGSFDFLDKLGIGASLPVDRLSDLLYRTDLAFLFAPQFYPALAALAPLRRALGQPTVFNYIGPLLNPADPVFRLIGVPNRHVQQLIADHLHQEGAVEHALIVNAQSGLDELDVHSTNYVARVSRGDNQGAADSLTQTSEELAQTQTLALSGKQDRKLSVDDSIVIFQNLIAGQLDAQNYYHSLVCLNAGLALRAGNLVDNHEEGAKIAAQLLKDGSVKAKFEQYQHHFPSE